MKSIIISKHTIFIKNNQNIFSTGSSIEDFLVKNNVDYLCIKHPLNNVSSSLGEDFVKNRKKNSVNIYPSSLVEYFYKGKLNKQIIAYQNSSILPIKTIQEFFATFKIIKKQKKTFDLFIGIDPLNALYGLILKKLNKVKKVVFYTADYAIVRFKNPVINWFYHFIDRFVSKNSDQVWNVSTRIVNLRKKQGISDEKNYFVPNSPPFNKNIIKNRINIHEIVTVGTTPSAINFNFLVQVINKVKAKFPDVTLKIIGGLDWKSDVIETIKKLKIEKNIIFIGKLNHDDYLEEVSHSALGYAFYTSEIPWTYYCDSMKIRDFFACGLPVLTNDIHSIADDVIKYNAGRVIKFNQSELTNTIIEIFKNKSVYMKMRKNAIYLAKKYDIDTILVKLLK